MWVRVEERGKKQRKMWKMGNVPEKIQDKAIKVSISYAGSMWTSLWSKIKEDRSLVGPGYGVVVVDWLTWT